MAKRAKKPEVGGDVVLKRNDLRVFVKGRAGQPLMQVNTSPVALINFSPVFDSVWVHDCKFSFKGEPTSLEIRGLQFRQVGKKLYLEPIPQKKAARRKK